MTDSPSPPRPWIGALTAVVLVAIATGIAVGFVVSTPSDVSNAETIAQVLAGVVLVGGLGAAIATALAWTRSKIVYALALVMGLGFQAAVLGLGLVMVSVLRNQSAAHLTDADRADLTTIVIDGRPWQRQRGLGFELEVPPDLAFVGPDPNLVQRADENPALARTATSWRWETPDHARVLIVTGSAFGSAGRGNAHLFTTYADASAEAIGRQEVEVREDRTLGDFERIVRFVGTHTGAVGYERFFGYVNGPRLIVIGISGVTRGDAPSLDAAVESLRPVE